MILSKTQVTVPRHEVVQVTELDGPSGGRILVMRLSCGQVQWRRVGKDARPPRTVACVGCAMPLTDGNLSIPVALAKLLARVVRERQAWGGVSGVFTSEDLASMRSFADAMLMVDVGTDALRNPRADLPPGHRRAQVARRKRATRRTG